MKIRINGEARGVGNLEWTLPDELAAQLADLGKGSQSEIEDAFKNNLTIFLTSMLSTVGNPARVEKFTRSMHTLQSVYS